MPTYTKGMPSSTDLVFHATTAGYVPANRPVDHIRRITTALAVGYVAGALLALVMFFEDLSVGQMALVMLPLLVIVIIAMIAWTVIQPEKSPTQREVVARTLATTESTAMRERRNGGISGLLVPVVAKPVDGSAPFLSVILMRNEKRGSAVIEPEPGTLLPLVQLEEGLGELTNVDEPSAAQLALISELQKRPRLLPNRATALPMRRAPLDRSPWWAAVEWWAVLVIAAILPMFIAGILSR